LYRGNRWSGKAAVWLATLDTLWRRRLSVDGRSDLFGGKAVFFSGIEGETNKCIAFGRRADSKAIPMRSAFFDISPDGKRWRSWTVLCRLRNRWERGRQQAFCAPPQGRESDVMPPCELSPMENTSISSRRQVRSAALFGTAEPPALPLAVKSADQAKALPRYGDPWRLRS
jgi:hypothetical protein